MEMYYVMNGLILINIGTFNTSVDTECNLMIQKSRNEEKSTKQ